MILIYFQKYLLMLQLQFLHLQKLVEELNMHHKNLLIITTFSSLRFLLEKTLFSESRILLLTIFPLM